MILSFYSGNSGCDEACQRAFQQAYATYNQIFTKEDQEIFSQLGISSV
jgi:hypothetical protein